MKLKLNIIIGFGLILSLFSNDEQISKDTAYYGIEYLNSNNTFVSSLNILNQTNLSTSIYSPNIYTINYSETVHTFKVYGFGTDYTYSGDRGRLSVQDIVVFYN